MAVSKAQRVLGTPRAYCYCWDKVLLLFQNFAPQLEIKLRTSENCASATTLLSCHVFASRGLFCVFGGFFLLQDAQVAESWMFDGWAKELSIAPKRLSAVAVLRLNESAKTSAPMDMRSLPNGCTNRHEKGSFSWQGPAWRLPQFLPVEFVSERASEVTSI